MTIQRKDIRNNAYIAPNWKYIRSTADMTELSAIGWSECGKRTLAKHIKMG